MELVFGCPDSDRTFLCDTANNSWFVAVQGKIYKIGDGSDQSALAVLPFLEMPFLDVERYVAVLLSSHSKLSFPYEFIVRAGFRHGSPHWTDCALKWLDELNELDANFTSELDRVISNEKRYSQKSRQLAKKMKKRRDIEHSIRSSGA